MSIALARRLERLERSIARSVQPSSAFVIWERTAEAALAALERAVAAGVMKANDPIVLGTIPEPAPLPALRWKDALSMSDDELEAMAVMQTQNGSRGDVRKMTDAELSNALIASVARPA